MFLKGHTLPTPCLIILNKEEEEKRKDADGSGHLLCLSAQLPCPLLPVTTHGGITSPLFQVTGFVGETPPSSRKQTHDSDPARGNNSGLDT